MDIQKERTEFEKFASSHGLCVTEDGGLYRSHVLAWMWKAWEARAEKDRLIHRPRNENLGEVENETA